MQEKVNNVIKFYNLATTLKNKIRSGWKLWHVSKERLESVAEHVYGTCILAIAIDSEFEVKIDLNKVLRMLVLHELEEVIIGDITPYDHVNKKEKAQMRKAAISKVLDSLVKKEEYEELLDEFNRHETNESKFAYECDKLEACLEAKLYDDGKYVNIFAPENAELVNMDLNEKAIEKGAKGLFDLFVEHDCKAYDEIFTIIANNIRNNKD